MDTDTVTIVEKQEKIPPSIKNDVEQNSMVKLASKLNGTVVSLKKAPSKGKRILISFSKSHKSYGFMIDNFIVIIYL